MERLYGKAKAVHPRDKVWPELEQLFPPSKSARQYVDFNFDRALTSCGFGVPFYEYQENRNNMDKWLERKDKNGIRDYWEEKNQLILDGLPTGILENES